MKKTMFLLAITLLLSGCAGTGFNKRATLMPDSVGLETDLDPNNDFRSKLVEMRATWNLK